MEQAFSKVSARLQEHRSDVVTKSQCAEHLARFIVDKTGYPISEKDIVAYWDTVESGITFHIPQLEVLNGLSQYLDFPDFETWYVAQRVSQQVVYPDPRRKWILPLIIAILILFGILVYQLATL